MIRALCVGRAGLGNAGGAALGAQGAPVEVFHNFWGVACVWGRFKALCVAFATKLVASSNCQIGSSGFLLGTRSDVAGLRTQPEDSSEAAFQRECAMQKRPASRRAAKAFWQNGQLLLEKTTMSLAA